MATTGRVLAALALLALLSFAFAAEDTAAVQPDGSVEPQADSAEPEPKQYFPLVINDKTVEKHINGSHTVVVFFLARSMPNLERIIALLAQTYGEKGADDIIIAAARAEVNIVRRYGLTKLPAVRVFPRNMNHVTPFHIKYSSGLTYTNFTDSIEQFRRAAAPVTEAIAPARKLVTQFLTGGELEKGNNTLLKRAAHEVTLVELELKEQLAKLEHYKLALQRMKGGPSWMAEAMNSLRLTLYLDPEHRTLDTTTDLLTKYSVLTSLFPPITDGTSDMYREEGEADAVYLDENGNRVDAGYWARYEEEKRQKEEEEAAEAQAARTEESQSV